MQKINWIDRTFTPGRPLDMLPFYIERMHGTIARLCSKVKDLSDDQLSYKLDSKWSIKQNIGHLGEVDEVGFRRIDEILDGISPMSSAVFDNKHDFNAMPIADVIAYFDGIRTPHIKHILQRSDDELLMTSLHPRLKINMSMVDLAAFHADHDDHHLVRIQEIIESL